MRRYTEPKHWSHDKKINLWVDGQSQPHTLTTKRLKKVDALLAELHALEKLGVYLEKQPSVKRSRNEHSHAVQLTPDEAFLYDYVMALQRQYVWDDGHHSNLLKEYCRHGRARDCVTCGWQPHETQRNLRVNSGDMVRWVRRRNPEAYMELLD